MDPITTVKTAVTVVKVEEAVRKAQTAVVQGVGILKCPRCSSTKLKTPVLFVGTQWRCEACDLRFTTDQHISFTLQQLAQRMSESPATFESAFHPQHGNCPDQQLRQRVYAAFTPILAAPRYRKVLFLEFDNWRAFYYIDAFRRQLKSAGLSRTDISAACAHYYKEP